jgi:outer membrane protein
MQIMNRKRTLRARGKLAVLVLIFMTSSLVLTAADTAEVLTLEQCLQTALSSGPQARRAQADLALSEGQYAEAKARNSLGLTTNAAAGRSDVAVDSRLVKPDTTAKASSNNLQAGLKLAGPSTEVDLSANYDIVETDPLDHSGSVSLSASQTLWDGYSGGRGYAAVQEAGITLQSERIAAQETRRSLGSQVRQAYFTLLSAQRTEALQEQILSQRRSELARVQALFDSGSANVVDLKQAQVNLKSAEIDLASARDGIISDREKLSLLVGWPADRVYSVAESTDLPVPEIEAAAAEARALEQRAELRQLQLSRKSGEVDLAVKRAQRSPTVSAGGSVGWTHDWTEDTDYATWSAQLSVSVPVADAGLAKAQIRQAESQNESLRVQEQQQAASITTEVRDAVTNLRLLVSKAELASQSLDLAQAQYDMAELQFESGLISPVDLLDASVTLGGARVALEQAQTDVQLGILSLKDAMGE